MNRVEKLGWALAGTACVLHLVFRHVGTPEMNSIFWSTVVVLVLVMAFTWMTDGRDAESTAFFSYGIAAYGALYLGFRFQTAHGGELSLSGGILPWAAGA